MTQSNHTPKFFLLAGSASFSAEAASLYRAHEFVRELTKRVLEAGDGFVVYTAAEPVNEMNQPLLFDWTVLREIDASHPGEASSPRVVIVLAESLGLNVIAEGVETSEQRDFLAQYGCHGYQGYFFGRPVPLDVLEAQFATPVCAASSASPLTHRATPLTLSLTP